MSHALFVRRDAPSAARSATDGRERVRRATAGAR
jgi:hypothetical protein